MQKKLTRRINPEPSKHVIQTGTIQLEHQPEANRDRERKRGPDERFPTAKKLPYLASSTSMEGQDG